MIAVQLHLYAWLKQGTTDRNKIRTKNLSFLVLGRVRNVMFTIVGAWI